MEKIEIYKFQLESIQEALRMTSNIHDSRLGETCFDRTVRQAYQYANNALEGKIDERVNYMRTPNEKEYSDVLPHRIRVWHTRKLEQMLHNEEITYSRMVEVLNEIAAGSHKNGIEL